MSYDYGVEIASYIYMFYSYSKEIASSSYSRVRQRPPFIQLAQERVETRTVESGECDKSRYFVDGKEETVKYQRKIEVR